MRNEGKSGQGRTQGDGAEGARTPPLTEIA